MTENYCTLKLEYFGPDGIQKYDEAVGDENVHWMSLAWRGTPIMLASGVWFILGNAKKGLEALLKL